MKLGLKRRPALGETACLSPPHHHTHAHTTQTTLHPHSTVQCSEGTRDIDKVCLLSNVWLWQGNVNFISRGGWPQAGEWCITLGLLRSACWRRAGTPGAAASRCLWAQLGPAAIHARHACSSMRLATLAILMCVDPRLVVPRMNMGFYFTDDEAGWIYPRVVAPEAVAAAVRRWSGENRK